MSYNSPNVFLVTFVVAFLSELCVVEKKFNRILLCKIVTMISREQYDA